MSLHGVIGYHVTFSEGHIYISGDMSPLTLVLLNWLLLFFIQLKLKLLTEFPTSNDEKFDK